MCETILGGCSTQFRDFSHNFQEVSVLFLGIDSNEEPPLESNYVILF